MRRTFKYGYFAGMSPICPARLAAYPELRYVAALTPDELRTADRGDLEDAQHQWAYTSHTRMMQHCFEEGCDAVRPVPLGDYPEADRTFILREFVRRNLPAA
jgi:hypothetical protein